MKSTAMNRNGSARCWLVILVFSATLLCGCKRLNAVSGQDGGVCVSQGGHFPKFSLEGHPPSKASKGPIGLTLCKSYKKKTCCDVVHTQAALTSLKKLATSGEASKDCLEKWEVLECSICDPHVGVTPGPPLLCQDFCDSLFSACADSYFSSEPLTQVLMPCGPKDILCAVGQEWASNSSLQFCKLAGFSVLDATDYEQTLEAQYCFDGRLGSAGLFSDGVERKSKDIDKTEQISALDMLRNWIENMNIAEQITWAVGGLVLTAGAWQFRRAQLAKEKTAAAVIKNKLLHEQAKARHQASYRGSNSSTSKKDRRHPERRLSPKVS